MTLGTSATLHLTGLFDLTDIIDHFGPLMSVGMIVGFALSIAVYVGGVLFHWGGKPIRMSGSVMYDFFMGGMSASLSARFSLCQLKLTHLRSAWSCSFAEPADRKHRPQGPFRLTPVPISGLY